jgi:hypothetical protein
MKNNVHENNTHTTNSEQDLIMDRQVFGGVQNFRYLGTMINSENLISDAIKSRSAAGIRCLLQLKTNI